MGRCLLKIGLVACLLQTGCLNLKQPPAEILHYHIEYETPQPEDLHKLDVVIKVRRFGISNLFNNDRLHFSDGKYLRDYYYYHRWAINPREMVTGALVRDFQTSEAFRAVLHGPTPASPHYELEGNVLEFSLRNDGDGWESSFSAEVMLFKRSYTDMNRELLFQKVYTHRVPARDRKPREIVESLSLAVKAFSAVIQEDLNRCIYTDHNREETDAAVTQDDPS